MNTISFQLLGHRLGLSSFTDWQWLIYGIVGVVIAVVGFTIIDWGILEKVSWEAFFLVAFFFAYTFILFILFGRQRSGRNSGSWRPNSLSRFRSYLTFLPITHIIQHSESKESLRAIDNSNSETDELSIRISIQKDLVIEAILDEYIVPWYTKISSNTAFLQQCKHILHAIFQQVGDKIQQVDRNEIAKDAIQIVHLHWKEYCQAASKSDSTGESIIKCFKFVHPYLQDPLEVSQRWEKMVCKLLEELVIPDFQSTLLYQFLSGILVKSFFFYYTELICQPAWINNNLITLLSSDSVLAELAGSSSQNSSAPATPLFPERSPKHMSGENFSDTILPSDCSPPQKVATDASDDCEEGHFIFEKKKAQEPEPQEWDRLRESPLNRATPSPSTSVSSALSGIIPTTALPLIPIGSYLIDPVLLNENTSILSVDTLCSKGLNFNGQNDTPETAFSITMLDIESTEDCSSTSKILQSQTNSNPKEGCQIVCDNEEINSGNFKATTPTHYYSFEEVSLRKTSHPMLDTATLSVDGVLDGKKKQEIKSNTHELKIAKDSDMKNSRSPVYEEPEDFATSIAKLRSLLEQKESKKNLLSTTAPSSENGVLSTSKAVTPTSDVSGDIVMAEDALRSMGEKALNRDVCEECVQSFEDEEQVPEIKCYFLNIMIPKVESYNDSGGQFDFYCIQYEGVYFDEKYEDQEGQPRKVILRTTTVKRRFKEFLLLQSKLEEQSHWKPHLKGIKAPNRWLNLSFSKADAANTRKTMLERYITQLCTHPLLGTSREVLQFMAYGDEGFSLDPMDVNDPKHLLSTKLDKLAKKFTGVMNSLKDALPSFDSNLPSPHSGNQSDRKSQISETSFEFSEGQVPEAGENSDPLRPSSMGPAWFEKLVSPLEENDVTNSVNESYPIFSNVTVNVSDASPDADSIADISSCTNYPLAAALTQLLCDVLWLPNCRPHNASVSTFMSLSGKSLENYVEETIDVFLSDEAVLGYLEWFCKSLKVDAESIPDFQYDLSTEPDLKNCLRKRIPAWVRWMWGRHRLDVTIERITGFFQNPILNQDLALSLSELIFSKITLNP